jgi:hypothetical protein
MAEGLPLYELDLSFNRFTSFGLWRLCCGYERHRVPDFSLVLGPYPINEFFLKAALAMPKRQTV